MFLPDDLIDFQKIASERNESLVTYLVKEKKFSERELQKHLAKVFDIEVIDQIHDSMIDPAVFKKFGIQFLKKNTIIPLKVDDASFLIALADPSQLTILEDLFFVLGCEPKPVLAETKTITKIINEVFGSAQEGAVSGVLEDAGELGSEIEEDIEDLLEDTSKAPFIKLVNMVIAQAVQSKASDIHIEPFKDSLRIRFRLDGVLYDKHAVPRKYHAAIVSRIKIMAKLNIAEKRLPQDGRISLNLGDRQVDLRVSCLPTSYGERIVLRLLEKSSKVLSMEELGLGGSDLEQVQRLVQISHGIILVTGPTGSGKTTSLYAVLNYINSPDKNILTIEDPIEYQLDGVGQMQVNSKIDLTFAAGLRSIVRQDPDVILIGEIRDKETADIAIQSALTGHLVFSTLHTNDAPSAIARLIDMGVEPFLLSSVLRAVIAQRLVRVLCKHCKEPFVPDDAALSDFGSMSKSLSGQTLYRAKGCSECMETGYKGRNAIYEIMEVSDAIKGLTVRQSSSNEIRKQAISEGMRTLKIDGCRKILAGMTSLAEVKRVSNI